MVPPAMGMVGSDDEDEDAEELVSMDEVRKMHLSLPREAMDAMESEDDMSDEEIIDE